MKFFITLALLSSLHFPAIAGNASDGAKIAEMCFGCHGKNGNPIRYSFPQLAGQSEEYMLNRLFLFKQGEGRSNVMRKVTEKLSPKNLSDLAAYFSQQSSKKFIINRTERIALGEKLYTNGNGKSFTPCITCHGEDGYSMDDIDMPILSLQHPRYITRRLRHFKRTVLDVDSSFADVIMSSIAKNLTDHDIKSVADYINSLSKVQEE